MKTVTAFCGVDSHSEMPIITRLNRWQVYHSSRSTTCWSFLLAFVVLLLLPSHPLHLVQGYSPPLQKQPPSQPSVTTPQNLSVPLPTITSTSMSLAGPYLIDTTTTTTTPSINDREITTAWRFIPLEHIPVDTDRYPTPGARAWAALMKFSSSSSSQDDLFASSLPCNCIQLQAKIRNGNLRGEDDGNQHHWTIHVTATTGDNMGALTGLGNNEHDKALLGVMARILVQYTLQRQSMRQLIADPRKHQGDITIQILDETNPIHLDIEDWKEFVQSSPSTYRNLIDKLFPDFAVSDESVEIVECVDRDKHVLGLVPRKLVHQYNLLHRGIGMFVTRDRPIFVPSSISSAVSPQQPPSQPQPDLYCHQRTATKRIFPSLFDMFVGGVSLAGEDPTITARREVAEELGLVAALETNDSSSLSSCLLTCIVCTGYNRCVVDLFCYTMNTQTEQIRWQPEEVAWGSFVPYDVVQDAASRSISRLEESNQWPGPHPPLASRRHAGSGETCDGKDKIVPEFLEGEWKNWDFVPDGLLVWEAWLLAIGKGV